MKEGLFKLNRHVWNSAFRSIRQLAASEEVGGKVKLLFSLLILLLLGINGLNVVNSYVGRDFMTAIEHQDRPGFVRMAFFYIAVFAASTVVAVVYRYIEERLGLLWREWATKKFLGGYANHRVYYRLKLKGEIGNPDQRIADDVRTFSVTTLSFVLMFLNGTFTAVAFSGVLWSISPLLFVVSVLYATAGTFFTFILGRPLVRLNYDQLDKEANFRSALVYLRGNAESVALSRREGHLIQLGLNTLGALAANFRRIISINRNVNFFTTGYNWMIQIIPALIVAPLFIEGKVQFGVITQSAIAFTQLLGAFSIIVTQFQSISSYAAVLARLGTLIEASEREKAAVLSATDISVGEKEIVYQGVTLCSPRSGRVLIKGLTLTIPYGTRVLVRGEDETARSALFHGTAGLWDIAEGHIVRPPLDQILLLPELPYLPPGTIRELALRPWPEHDQPVERSLASIQVPEQHILHTLRTLKIDSLLSGFGGLDTRHHWENTLPLDDQQLLVVARVLLAKPQFAFLDRPSTTLSQEKVDWILELLRERGITYVTFEHADHPVRTQYYDAILELKEGGSWAFAPVKEAKIPQEPSLSVR